MDARIAVDIGGTQIRAACYPDGALQPLAQLRAATQQPGKTPLESMFDLIAAVWPQDARVARIAVAAPGPDRFQAGDDPGGAEHSRLAQPAAEIGPGAALPDPRGGGQRRQPGSPGRVPVRRRDRAPLPALPDHQHRHRQRHHHGRPLDRGRARIGRRDGACHRPAGWTPVRLRQARAPGSGGGGTGHRPLGSRTACRRRAQQPGRHARG